MTACRSCGAEIFWATTARGKAMPIDAAPVAHGNVRLTQAHPPIAEVLSVTAAWDGTEPRYTSHFATCPNAGAHRRR